MFYVESEETYKNNDEEYNRIKLVILKDIDTKINKESISNDTEFKIKNKKDDN